ncbi:MAG: endonuclease/exonuclease/phosphatase family protein [Pseudoscardovia radai]|nr:endonuclease/exonuclease/phosphatase family protein [Pseudoscardovia radai]
MPPLTIILWILLALLALWMAMRALPAGADHASPTQIQLTALTPLLWLPLAVIGVWALARHTPAQAIVAIVLLLVDLLFSAGYAVRLPGGLNTALGNPAQSTMSTADRSAALASCSGADSATRCVTVMTVNARYGKADASAIVHAAKQYDVDVLAIQEVYGDLKSRLDEEGLGEVFPHCVLGAQSDADNGGVNAICSRAEPVATTDDAIDAKAAHVPAVTLAIDGVNVTFVSAHVASPHRGADRWGDGLAALTRLGTPSGAGAPDPVVLMGDLNANLSHASYRAMLRNGGFSDVSYEMHGGTHLSFPASWSFVPSLLELDHVVHTQGVTGLDMRTLSIPRTDHKAQIATLRIDGTA